MVEGEGSGMHYGQLRNQIKDWGLSHPTLEEVFLKLTNKADDQELERRRSNSFQRTHDLRTSSGDLHNQVTDY